MIGMNLNFEKGNRSPWKHRRRVWEGWGGSNIRAYSCNSDPQASSWMVCSTNGNSTLPPFHTFPLTPLFPLNLTAVPASKHEYQLFEKLKSSFINWLTAWMCQYVWDYEAELCTQRTDTMTCLFQVFFKKYMIQMWSVLGWELALSSDT